MALIPQRKTRALARRTQTPLLTVRPVHRLPLRSLRNHRSPHLRRHLLLRVSNDNLASPPTRKDSESTKDSHFAARPIQEDRSARQCTSQSSCEKDRTNQDHLRQRLALPPFACISRCHHWHRCCFARNLRTSQEVWGIETSVFTRVLRDFAEYSEFASIEGLQRVFDLGSFLPTPKDGLITPVTFRVKRRGLRGFLAEVMPQKMASERSAPSGSSASRPGVAFRQNGVAESRRARSASSSTFTVVLTSSCRLPPIDRSPSPCPSTPSVECLASTTVLHPKPSSQVRFTTALLRTSDLR